MKLSSDYKIEEYLIWILNCQIGNNSELSVMLDNGYDINTKDDDGHNGLYHSIENDEIETSLFLIEKGIKPTQSDLIKACDKELKEIVETILNKICKEYKKNIIDEAFYSLSLLSSYDFMEWFIQKYTPDVNYCEGHSLTPLSNVATMGDKARLNLLISKGADVRKKGYSNLDTLEWCYEVKDNPGVIEIIKIIHTLIQK